MSRGVVVSGGLVGLVLGFGSASFAGWPVWPCAIAWGLLMAVASGLTWHSLHPETQGYGTSLLRATETQDVALTFDDGPDPEVTPRLLAALGDRHRATFFLLVDRAVKHPDLVRQIAQHHQVALHGASHHPWLTLMGPTSGGRELLEAKTTLERLAGDEVRDFRPPFGAVSPRLFASTTRAKLRTVWCSLRPYDGVRLAPRALLKRTENMVPGDIVLLHERPWTADALPELLTRMERNGRTSKTVDELCPGS